MKITKALFPLSLILFLLAGWLGYDMFRLQQQELLWGNRPLVFLLAAWSCLVIWWVLFRKRQGKAISWRRLGLASLSGLLLSIGFPALLPVPWLLFLGFVPLLIIESELVDQSKNKMALWGYSYHAFVVWNIITTFWVANSAMVAGGFAIFVNALLMTLPILGYQATKKILPKWESWAFGVYWISFELLHFHWDLAWPWLSLGNGFAAVSSTVQWYEFTGVFGGTAWVLVMNIMLWKTWTSYQAEQKWPKPMLLKASVVAILPILISLGIYFTYQEAEDSIEVVVIQPNYEPHYEKFEVAEQEQIQQFLLLAKNQLSAETDYLVLPETSFGYVETTVINDYPSVKRIRAELADFPDLKIITGLNAYHDFLPGEKQTSATRERQRAGGQKVYFETYNLAAQITIGQEEVQTYRKSKLVPGPEVFPFKTLFPFMEPLVKFLGGTTAGLGTQVKRSPMTSETGRIAPVICYESVFGDYFTGYIRRQSRTELGSQAAFIMTNDGWWDNTLGHRQHLYYASLRAIETRRSIARSANTGISAFINQRGDIEQATEYDEAVAIKGMMNLNDAFTFYVRWGDLIARISLFLAGLLILNTISKAWMNRVSKPKE